MIGHWQGMLTTGSCNGLGRTRFGGFFYGRQKNLAARTAVLAARISLSAEFRRRPLGDLRSQFQ
jgi:hypothetical protein